MASNDVNLLPEKDRRAADEAVKKATAQKQEREIKLVVPTLIDAKAQPAKPGLFKRMFGKKSVPAATDAEMTPKKGMTAESGKKIPASSSPMPTKKEPVKPAPTNVPAPKPMTAPKMAPTPTQAQKVTPAPKAPEVAPAITTMRKDKSKEKPKGKMHQPESDLSSAGPDVNLVPEYVKEEAADKPWVLAISVLVFVIALWVIASGVTISRAKRAEARLQQIGSSLAQINAAIQNSEEEKKAAQTLQKQFSLVKTALDNHVYWSPFLQKLQDTTIPDVYYTTMTAAKDGASVQLRAIAKTYTAAARQVRAFERSTQFVQSVEIHEASLILQPNAALPVPVVQFDILLKLVPNTLQIELPTASAAPSTGGVQPVAPATPGQPVQPILPDESAL